MKDAGRMKRRRRPPAKYNRRSVGFLVAEFRGEKLEKARLHKKLKPGAGEKTENWEAHRANSAITKIPTSPPAATTVNNGKFDAGKSPDYPLCCVPCLPIRAVMLIASCSDQSQTLPAGLDGQKHHRQTQMGPRIPRPSQRCRQLHEPQAHQHGGVEGWKE
jgi:hypothetical protein